jgi:hypothetical protein
LRDTSREIVEGERPSCAAIVLNDSPAASPREISSRSTTLRQRGDLVGIDGRTPPVADKYM